MRRWKQVVQKKARGYVDWCCDSHRSDERVVTSTSAAGRENVRRRKPTCGLYLRVHGYEALDQYDEQGKMMYELTLPRVQTMWKQGFNATRGHQAPFSECVTSPTSAGDTHSPSCSLHSLTVALTHSQILTAHIFAGSAPKIGKHHMGKVDTLLDAGYSPLRILYSLRLKYRPRVKLHLLARGADQGKIYKNLAAQYNTLPTKVHHAPHVHCTMTAP